MGEKPKYRIAGGEPTAKWKASAGSGVGAGAVAGIVIAYFIARVDPTMPPEVVGALVWLCTWGLTQSSMMLAGYLARPAAKDRPEVDPATLPKRPVEPLPGIPPED